MSPPNPTPDDPLAAALRAAALRSGDDLARQWVLALLDADAPRAGPPPGDVREVAEANTLG